MFPFTKAFLPFWPFWGSPEAIGSHDEPDWFLAKSQGASIRRTLHVHLLRQDVLPVAAALLSPGLSVFCRVQRLSARVQVASWIEKEIEEVPLKTKPKTASQKVSGGV